MRFGFLEGSNVAINLFRGLSGRLPRFSRGALLLERRRLPRQNGNLMDIFMGDGDLPADTSAEAQLQDYSRGGLGLWLFHPIAVGAVFNVGIPNACRAEEWDTVYWLPVKVAHCRRSHLGWVVGCQFLEALSSEPRETLDRLHQQ